MAEPRVTIQLITKADAAPVDKVDKSINQLKKDVRDAKRELSATAPNTPAFEVAQQKVTALKAEIKELSKTHEAAKVPAINFGQAMLQGSRGVQDFAAAGIPGMVNNVESLAAALGLGASAAGGVTLAFVGLELLMRNWDSIFGTAKANQAKAFWSAITPDEAYATRLEKIATAQERMADAIQRTATVRKLELEARQTQADWLEASKKEWEAILPKADPANWQFNGEPSPESLAAANAQAAAESDAQAKQGAFNSKDQAVQEQEARVRNMNYLAGLPETIKLQNAKDEAELERLSRLTDEGIVSAEDARRIGELMEGIKARTASLKEQAQLVPGLTDGLTGDPEKDREKLGERAEAERATLKRLEEERYQLAKEVDAARQAQTKATAATAAQVAKDWDKTSRALFKGTGQLPLPGVAPGVDAALMSGKVDMNAGDLPTLPGIPEEPPTTEEPGQVTDGRVGAAQDDLRQLSGLATNAAKKAEIDALIQDLNDGASTAEMERVRALVQSMNANKTQAMGELADGLAEFAAQVSAELGSVRSGVNRALSLVQSVRTRGD